MIRAVLAIDPGRAKCGLALVREGVERTIQRSIVSSEQTVVTVARMLRLNPDVSTIIVGSGTGSRNLVRALRDTVPSVKVEVVDEQGTSLLARARYLKENPPKGWKRLVPVSLLTPPEPYDDYAALLLAERYLQSD